MTDIAARRELRKRIMAASAARHKRPRFPRPLPPNGIILAHTRFLLAVSKDMDQAILATLKAEGLFRKDAAAEDLDSLAKSLLDKLGAIASRKNVVGAIDEIGLRTKRFTRAEWQRQLQSAMGVDLTADPDLGRVLESFRKRQGDLITSLSQDKIRRVKRILREQGANARVEDTTRLIQEQLGITKSRAALIARTEAVQLNSRMMRARHQAAGIHSFEVSTSQDERVRPSHRVLEGRVFEYSNLPVIDGEPWSPGMGFQCRCASIPCLDELG